MDENQYLDIIVSTHEGYVHVEQLAVVCDVNVPTARDMLNGRHSQHVRGEQFDGEWYCSHAEVMAILRERWGI